PFKDKRILEAQEDHFQENCSDDPEDDHEKRILMEVDHNEHPRPGRRDNVVKVSVEVVGPGLEDEFSKRDHGKCRCEYHEREEVDRVESGQDAEDIREVFRAKVT